MKNSFAKRILTFLLLIIFVSAPMASFAKSDKHDAGPNKNAVVKTDNHAAKAQKETNNQEKTTKKDTHWVTGLSKNLDSIEKSLQKITLSIDIFTGVNTSGSSIQVPTTSGSGIETTSGSAIDTTSGSAIDTTSGSAIDTTSGSAITGGSISEEQDGIESADDEDDQISVKGFVNGNKGKLRALGNRLRTVQKQLARVSQETAATILSRIEALTANIAEQLKRLNSITVQPVPSNTGSVPGTQVPNQTTSPSAIQIPDQTTSPSAIEVPAT